MEVLHGLLFMAVFFASVALYFVPALVAHNRHHRNADAITALDLLLGWTVLGWIAALVWALTADTRRDGG